MRRTAVNPWRWSADRFEFNQGELIEGAQRVLECSGQAANDGEGAPQHAGDMRAQIGLVLDNIDAVLAEAQMSLSDVTRLVIFTTDVDGFLNDYDVVASRLKAAGVKPASTLIGVARLAFPELMVEIQATAMQ